MPSARPFEERIGRLREQVGSADAGAFGERLVREHGYWHKRRSRTADGASCK